MVLRVGRTTADQIHAIRQILEKTWEYNISTFYHFINFIAAYISIRREKQFLAMEEFVIPTKLA
jgi:hypothetical protein